jgi:putative membrane protein
MNLLISWIFSALAVLVAAYLLPGVAVSGFVSALAVALVLGFLNAFIKPILIILTLPINILTLGLFTLVINAAIILLASGLVPGFKVDGFLYALIFGIIMSVMGYLLHLSLASQTR